MLNLGAFRNRVFVSRRIQGRLMLRVSLYWVGYHVVLWHGLLVYRFAQSRLFATAGTPSVPSENPFWQVASEYFPVVLCGLLTLPVVLIDMLHVSHRIAGPLVQFRSALLGLMAGRKVDRVILRKQDLLQEFQEDFNSYLASLNHRPSGPSREAVGTSDLDWIEGQSVGSSAGGESSPVVPLRNSRRSGIPLSVMAVPSTAASSN